MVLQTNVAPTQSTFTSIKGTHSYITVKFWANRLTSFNEGDEKMYSKHYRKF